MEQRMKRFKLDKDNFNDESTTDGKAYIAMLDWTGRERHPTGANGFLAGVEWAMNEHKKAIEWYAQLRLIRGKHDK
jgi:hypothetical protein